MDRGLRHCGISTGLKFQEFATKPDGVASVMPTSHDCDSDTHVQLFVFISEVIAVLISTYETSVSIALFPGSSRPSFCQLSASLGMRL